MSTETETMHVWNYPNMHVSCSLLLCLVMFGKYQQRYEKTSPRWDDRFFFQWTGGRGLSQTMLSPGGLLDQLLRCFFFCASLGTQLLHVC